MDKASPRSSSIHPVAAWLLVGCTVATAGYGWWVTLMYDGVVLGLIPFAVVSSIGAVLAAIGALQKSTVFLGLGLILQLAAPAGSAWIFGIAETIVGVTLLILWWRSSK